jgi:aminopeptidase N
MFSVRAALLRVFSCCALFSVFCGAPASAADEPYSFDRTFGRLPKTVVPLDYDITLHPDIAGRVTSGHEVVRLRVRQATATIVFNTLEMTISRASLGSVAGVLSIATDTKLQQTTLRFAHAVAPGNYALTLDFAGKIGTEAQGLFVQPYSTKSGAQESMLATQFESTDARRMFPSWDEPAYRATYRLTVTVPPDFEAVSNMPVASEKTAGGVKTVAFERTPKMSTYLVVFCAGRFKSISDTVDGVRLRVVAPADRIEQGRYALGAEKELLAYYDAYYDYKFPLPKLDLIDVPGGFPGAMENWGGITFNEGTLLFDPTLEPESAKQEIFQTIAHEMSHQWTGDLVTMDWWSGIWLNESFADWMQTKAADHFNPQWHLWDRVEADVEGAMSSDQRTTSHPVEQPVQDESQAAAAFDEITYQKGGAVVRMMEQYLGEDTFRDGVRAYIKAHAYSNSTAADLWAGLDSAAHRNVESIASGFIDQPGLPLVTADATCSNGRRTLALSQSRFFVEPGPHPSSAATTWTIPVGISSDGKTSYTLLSGKTADVDGGPCDRPFSVNAGALGYYRVRLDPASTAEQIARLGDLTVAERARFIGDTDASMLAGAEPPAQLFAAIASVRPDDALSVWSSVRSALGDISDLEAGESGRAAFDAYQIRTLGPVFALVGWDPKPGEDPQTESLRSSLIRSLGESGDPAVIAEAQKRFAAFLSAPGSLPAALRSPVLEIAGTYADAATWDALHARFVKAKNSVEAQQFAIALWFARDPVLAAKNLKMAADGEIPSELGSTLGYEDVLIVSIGGRHPELAWPYLKAHVSDLSTGLSNFERAQVVPAVAPLFWNTAPAAELDALIDDTPGIDPVQAARAKHAIAVRLNQRSALLPSIDAAIRV